MTRDELIEKVANAICESRHDEFNWWHTLDGAEKHQFRLEADAAINTIFDALKEPTDEMCFAGGEYVLSVGSIDCMHVDDRSEFGMKGRETGSYELFQAMLNASPLAKDG